MKVELLDHMGDDLAVVNAARVSFDKESEWEVPEMEFEWGIGQAILSSKDTKLIHYLATHGHWTPFSHCYAKFRIKAPLFVRSQLFKHKVGLTENEVSRRYVDSKPEFYFPESWRKRAEDKKQGSSEETIDLSLYDGFDGEHIKDIIEGYGKVYQEGRYTPEQSIEEDIDNALDTLRVAYKLMIKIGVCPEQARMILPQSMYTEWIWSGSLAAFARVYSLRTSDHAQKETQEIAYQIGAQLGELFPISWGALTARGQSSSGVEEGAGKAEVQS